MTPPIMPDGSYEPYPGPGGSPGSILFTGHPDTTTMWYHPQSEKPTTRAVNQLLSELNDFPILLTVPDHMIPVCPDPTDWIGDPELGWAA